MREITNSFPMFYFKVNTSAAPAIPAIGIDLGTINSCVAVFTNGKIEIIPNSSGFRTTPSYVAFNDEGFVIGKTAKSQATLNATNTVFEAKRLIGKNFNETDLNLVNDLHHWPFVVTKDNGDNPKIEVEYKKEKQLYAPEQISALILTALAEYTSTYLGKTVTDVVITIPAYFDDGQRKATFLAGELAGLNVLRLIAEKIMSRATLFWSMIWAVVH